MEDGYNVEDLAAAMITFENGASLVVEASWGANIGPRELMETRLLGTKAGLVQRNIGETYGFEAEIYMEKHGAQYDMKPHPPVPAAVSAQYHFVDSIVTDTPHMADGHEGLIVMELLDAIYRSGQTGEPQKVEKLD
jgi:predicted dehydrogenase